VFPLEKDDGSLVINNNSKLSIPLMVRGQNIGTIDINPKNAERGWTNDELALLEVAAERAALSLENARLLQDAQKLAAKERTISEGAARVSAALDVENILQATAEELERALGSSDILIQLESEE
jgi:GAF domain-containing protein